MPAGRTAHREAALWEGLQGDTENRLTRLARRTRVTRGECAIVSPDPGKYDEHAIDLAPESVLVLIHRGSRDCFVERISFSPRFTGATYPSTTSTMSRSLEPCPPERCRTIPPNPTAPRACLSSLFGRIF